MHLIINLYSFGKKGGGKSIIRFNFSQKCRMNLLNYIYKIQIKVFVLVNLKHCKK
jgi:hypothetical protein